MKTHVTPLHNGTTIFDVDLPGADGFRLGGGSTACFIAGGDTDGLEAIFAFSEETPKTSICFYHSDETFYVLFADMPRAKEFEAKFGETFLDRMAALRKATRGEA